MLEDTKKLISVIIPCYNVESYIRRCIDSLLNQTIGIDKLELIFVNDASTDSTLSILYEYEELYPESIMVINLEENIRQGGARNIGIQYAAADYIGFVDSDDWIEHDMYEYLYREMCKHDCDIVTCGFIRDLGDGVVSNEINQTGKLSIIQGKEDRRKFLLEGMTEGVWCKLYKKEFIVDNNIYFLEKTAYEDNFFNGLLSFYVKSYVVTEKKLYHYFFNQNSTSLEKNSKKNFERLKVEIALLEELKKRNLFQEFHSEIEYRFLRIFYKNTLHIIFLRFDYMPYDVYLAMRNLVISNFPNYIFNEHITEDDVWWIKTIRHLLTEKELIQLKERYIALF